VICENAEVRQVDDALTKLIVSLHGRLNSNNGREFATIVADQLRWRELLWRQCTPLAAACLLPKFQARYNYLKPKPEEIAGELYLSSGIKVGGLPLELQTLSKPGVYLAEKRITDPAERIDIAERYIDPTVDALAFVANRGGSGMDCAQFPVYIVAVRRDVAPEVVTIPNILGSPREQQSCVSRISRIADGFLFEIGAWPWVDGKVYAWKPKGGLFVRATTRFVPKSGAPIRDLFIHGDPNGRLNNALFYDALRIATTALDLSLATASEAFWFSWSEPYRRGDYIVLDTCARPGMKGQCAGDFVGKAVYEQRTDKVFFAFSSAASPPECKPANGRDPIDAALGGVQFFPPRFRWQPAALLTLKDSYCRIGQ
jgi:hypothetical protein